ncbi:LLM class flavin-dependent oxidoreductase [Nocardia sp. NPDC050378]|uniref:LLM class flavin-dependent oxidoreductase n=1 Tax=Nocardia sp. NPDC050378 TaxID=3155400 RepID=UPI0033FBBEFA
MTDYGQPLRFGIFPTPDADSAQQVLAVVETADRDGLDLVGVQDHPYQSRHLDTFTLMAFLLARTQRIQVFPDVANLPLRPPAVLAKAAAGLGLLSGGRFQLGLGAGGFNEAVQAMGGPARNPREAAEALEEAIDVIRLMWSGQRSVRYDGSHYQLAGVHPGPAPTPAPGIWLGVRGPRLLRALGRKADGWVPSSSYVPPSDLPEMQRRIDDSAQQAGRDPREIRRVYNVFGTITTDGSSSGAFSGPVDQWVEELTDLVIEYGMDTFVFGAPADDPVQLRRWAREVVPAVRESVERHRGN